jgi:hypothetical protein
MPSTDPAVGRRANKKYRLNHPDKVIATNRVTNARSRLARAIIREELLAKQRAQEERERRDQAKVCTECDVLKPFDDFRNDKYRPHGKSAKCRDCKQKRDKEVYWLNPEPRRATTAAWQATHVEEREIYDEAYKPRKKALRKIHYEENREAVLAQNTAWHAAHPGYAGIKSQRRRARQAQAAISDLSPAQWEEIKQTFNFRCVYCPPDCKACKKKTHVLEQEHLTPVEQNGDYTVHNIVPACRHHNAQKHDGPVLNPVQPLLLTEASPRKPRTKKGS